MSAEAHRFDWMDRARGIAMVLIVVGHVWNRLWKTGQLTSALNYEGFRDFLYSFHVPVFFFISAILFARSWQRAPGPELLKKRTVQLLYPYFVWSLLQTAVEVISGSVSENPVGEFLRILYWPRAHFWFLPTLWLLMMMCAGFYKLFKGKNTWVKAFGALSLVLYGLNREMDITPFQDLAKNGIYFAAGVACVNLPERLETHPPLKAGLVGILLLFGLISWVWIPDGGTTDVLGQPLLAFSGISATLSLACLWPGGKADPRLLGRKSLVIYVAHILAAYAVMDLLSRFGLGWQLLLVIGTLAGVVLPLVLDALCNRLRFPWLFSVPQV